MRRIGPSVGHSRLYSGLIDKLVIIYFHLFILFHYYFCFIQLCRPMAVARRLIEINGMFLLLERRGIVVYRRLVRTVGGEVPLRGGEFCLRLVVTTSKPWDSAFFIFCFPFPFFHSPLRHQASYPMSWPKGRSCVSGVPTLWFSPAFTSDFNARNGIILLTTNGPNWTWVILLSCFNRTICPRFCCCRFLALNSWQLVRCSRALKSVENESIRNLLWGQ